MEPDFGSWQTLDISRSHLYRGTIAWTPPTAIYRAYTVMWKLFHVITSAPDKGILSWKASNDESFSMSCFILFHHIFFLFFFRLATQSSITLTASPGYEKVLNRPTTAAAFPSRRTIRSLLPISAKAVFHITWSKVSGTTWRLDLCCWTAVCWTASSGEPQRKH